MTFSRHGPAALFLVLTPIVACSDAAEDTAKPAPAETMMPVEPDGGIGDGAGPPMIEAQDIPAAFQGVWDYVEGACDPASDLRIDIRPDAMQFYESMGEVTSIEVDSANRIVVSLNMEGEGETWQMDRVFTLTNEGETLTPTAVDEEEQYKPMPLKKCPA